MQDNKNQEKLMPSANIKAMKADIVKHAVLTGVVLVVACIAVFAFITTAWFASNKNVDANNAQAEVAVSDNLIISKETADVAASTLFQVSFALDEQDVMPKLKPATHDTTFAVGSLLSDEATYLLYNTNAKVVSKTKGLAADNEIPLTFDSVPVYLSGDRYRYYIDYPVYIAAQFRSINLQHLLASISVTPASGTLEDSYNDYLNAVSVDFFREGIYCGTVNAAGIEYTSIDGSTPERTAVDLVLGEDTLTVPLQTEGYISILLRCYFDGALLKSAGQTYVYSQDLSEREFTLNVSIVGVDAAG